MLGSGIRQMLWKRMGGLALMNNMSLALFIIRSLGFDQGCQGEDGGDQRCGVALHFSKLCMGVIVLVQLKFSCVNFYS